MEDLISNHLTPLTSRNPTLIPTPPPPGNPFDPSDDPPPKEIPVPLPPPPASRTYERTPTIPSINKLKGRSNYKTWIINIKLYAQNIHVWLVIQGQQASEEQKALA